MVISACMLGCLQQDGGMESFKGNGSKWGSASRFSHFMCITIHELGSAHKSSPRSQFLGTALSTSITGSSRLFPPRAKSCIVLSNNLFTGRLPIAMSSHRPINNLLWGLCAPPPSQSTYGYASSSNNLV